MNTEEKAQWLSDFWQKVADGGQMQLNSTINGWADKIYSGPNNDSDPSNWRIKPTPKKINMAIFIKSGIDCEFSDGGELWSISKLTGIDRGNSHNYICTPSKAIYCRPRMSPHIHYWGGGACPIPDGFKVRIYYRNHIPESRVLDFQTINDWQHIWQDSDIIAFEILSITDGWEL